MTVLLRQNANIRGCEEEIKVFQPSGFLTREDQQRAERLDDYLSREVPPLAEGIMGLPATTAPMRKWYLLGQGLRKIIDGNELVLRSDVQNGLIWEAIRQHMPESIGLKGAGQAQHRAFRKDANRGHLPVCYAAASYAWKDVRWLRRWNDWCIIYHRESMWRDSRILESLRQEIRGMKKYPKQGEFEGIIKALAAQTTKRRLDVLDNSAIAEKVHQAVEQAAHHAV